jgi:phospholipid/cholesterol/gamma-HCH transport system ATP-binding protein
MIQVKDVVKSFDGNVVLNHVSANFEDGKVNMIIGQSGSGKTVLMKSMIGLHQIDGGEIIFDTSDGQQNLAGMTEKEVRMLHREVGMLFQGAALFDSMTVQENVMYPLEMFSDMTDEEKVARARFCLERVNMPERAFNLMPSEISGGMQKRVAIARAIALNPKYLFCDEPNSGLDPQTSIVIDNLIHDITKEYNITTIINTHDMNSVMEIGEKIVFIYEGNKWWEGSKDDILHADNRELDDFVFASAMAKRAKKNIR